MKKQTDKDKLLLELLEELESILVCIESGSGFLPEEYKKRLADTITMAKLEEK